MSISLLTTGTPVDSSGDWLEQTRMWATRIWEFRIFTVDATPVTVGKLVIAALVLVFGVIIARMIARRVGERVLPRMRVDRGPAAALQSILYYLLLAIVVMLALQMASVPLTIFTILGGALALGIGFGSQNIVANFISGLILLIERPVGVGDLIEVQGERGVVEKVGARATLLKTYEGARSIIPNSILLENMVLNWNHKDDLVRSVVAVGVAYGSPTDKVRSRLLDVCAAEEGVLEEPPPSILFTDFADSALIFEVHSWQKPASVLERLTIESNMRFAIDRAFREADIGIAFPQQDVHLDTQRPLEIRVIENNGARR